jgi:undecaprenyl-diphosphatase
VFAYLSLVVLMRWFNQHEFNALKPFAYYCAAAGLVSLGLMLVI